MDIPSNTMESDAANTLVEDRVAISAEIVPGRTPQRRSNRQALQNASATIKSMYQRQEGGCKSRVREAPKRHAVGSPEAGDLNTRDPDYSIPIALSDSESDDEMREPWEDLQPSPRSSISMSGDDRDKEQDPSLGPCTVELERISLGADGDARACIQAKKKEAPAKRIVKRPRRSNKERVPGRTYRWVENCFHKREVPDPSAGQKTHPKPIAIYATCKLCLYKNPKAKSYGVKTKRTHCPSWTGCVKHVQNCHCLHSPEEIDEAIANPKAHWDNLEDKKARERGRETRHQGQSTLDECVPEYWRGSAERKRCMAKLARLCAVENVPLHIGTRPGFLKFMRKWEPRWPSISKQSVTRSVEGQSEQLRKDIRMEMEEVHRETDVAFTTDFWTSPTAESFMTMSMHWITRDWRLKTRIMGTINFPERHTARNISDKLMDLRLDFGVYPRSRDGRRPQSMQAMRNHKLFYFKEEPELDRPVLTSDCGSDVSAGAERDGLWDWNRCACHCLNLAVQAALKEEVVHECLSPLTELAAKFSKSRHLWNKFKKTQMEILEREEERSDDEGEADFDGDEDFEVGGEGEPRLKKVLRLIRPVPTRWNSTYYLVKRALALKDALVQFAAGHRPRPGEHPAKVRVDYNVEVFARSCSWTTTACPSSLCSKVVSCRS